MVLVLAEAYTSAGAPWLIWVARPELGPKLNTTLVPGWAASNCVPILVNASFREAAANTLTVPDSAGELATGAEDVTGDPPVVLDEPHPASRSPAVATTVKVRAVRRISCSKVQVGLGLRVVRVLTCGTRLAGSAMGRHFDDHVGGLHRCHRQDAGFKLELVSGFP